MAKNVFGEIDYNAIGQRVRNARLKRKMTQEVLAERVGISPSYASAIETGSSKVALPTLIQISKVLETTLDALLFDVVSSSAYKYDLEAKQVLDDCSEAEREFLLNTLRKNAPASIKSLNSFQCTKNLRKGRHTA